MKFFTKNYIDKYKIDSLKRVLRVSRYNKRVDYNGNYIEVIEMEKPVLARNPDEDIYRLIRDYLEIWIDITGEEMLDRLLDGKNPYYSFDDLPPKLKRVMREHDLQLYEMQYKDYRRRITFDEDYDSREERLRLLIPEYTDADYEKYVLLGHPIPSTLGRRAKESARRSYKEFNGIIKSNVHKFRQFVTLTFANLENKDRHLELNATRLDGEEDVRFEYIDSSNFEAAKTEYTKFIRSIRDSFSKRGEKFEFVTVWELQKNGNYHFHMLCSEFNEADVYKVPDWLDINYVTGLKNNGHALQCWRHGKSDVQLIKDPAKVTTYVSKYIIKSFLNVTEDSYMDYLNKKKYFCSTGLARPESSYIDNTGLDKNFELTLEKEYRNYYNDGIIKKRYYAKID